MRVYFGVLIFFIGFAPSLCEPQEWIVNPKDGRSYKLMYYAQTWTMARDSCVNIGAKLAVPKSKDQFTFLQKIVRSMHYPSIVGAKNKLLVWLGISNLHNESGTWQNVDGENIEDTGFHTWAGKNNGVTSSSYDPREPHCVVIDAMNIGLRDWWCHLRQPYICEMRTQTSLY